MEKVVRFWKWIRGTLIFNIIEAFILVVVFLMALFTFLPSEATIAIENGRYVPQSMFQNKSCLTLTAKGCNIYLSNAKFVCRSGCDVHIMNCDVIVDDAVYDASKLIVESNVYVQVLVPAETELTVLSLSGAYMTQLSDHPNVYFDSPAYILADNPFYIEAIGNSTLFIETDTGEKEPVGRCEIIPHDMNAIMCISKDSNTLTLSISDFPWKDGGFKKLLAYSDVTFAEIMMEGTVNFVYTLEAQTYPIYQQKLKLKNGGNGLNAIIEGSADGKEMISFYGRVTKASIGERDLFPGFRKWFVDNAYLAPATLLATFIGAVGLVKQQRKKDEQ